MTKKKVKENEKQKLPIYFLAALVLLQVIVIALTMFVSKSGGAEAKTPGDSTATSIIPIWFVIMIPFLVRKNKKLDDAKRNKLSWILVGVATAVLLVMLIFLIKVIT